jgi:DnaK suppressor protein
MDIFDRAQEQDEFFRQKALDKHFAGRNSARSENTPYEDRDCLDCGETIPAKRLEANPIATRCVPCQTKYERKES